QLRGDAFPVAEHAVVGPREGAVAVSAGVSGPIAYRSGPPSQTQLEWFDRSGNVIEKAVSPGSAPAFSPDGRLVAVQRFVDGNFDIWLIETANGRTTRFTFDAGDDAQPAWSPDGGSIVFASSRKEGHFQLYRKPVNGAPGSE